MHEIAVAWATERGGYQVSRKATESKLQHQSALFVFIQEHQKEQGDPQLWKILIS